MNVLVTGGAGFIGTNLCRLLSEDERFGRVIALDNLSTGYRQNLEDCTADLVVGDILDADLVRTLVNEVDAVVHLAARGSVPRSIEDPVATHQVNVNGTLSVLEACRARGDVHLVFASSSSVYGANPILPKAEHLATMPISPYGASKLAAESYVLAYQHAYQLPTLAFRFFNVYGPYQAAEHDYAAVIPKFIAAAHRGEAVTIHGDGRQTRDFTFVGSVVDTICMALRDRLAHPSPVNLAFGVQTELQAVLDLIEQLSDCAPIERQHVATRLADIRASQADPTLLKALFPDAAPRALEAGLAATIDWFSSGGLRPDETGYTAPLVDLRPEVESSALFMPVRNR
ncbi:MAG: NAD-dependent epimerase/dehydratase family protein [Acidimicrobiia bacterium]